MLFGVDYYPEHWPEERWGTDLDLMKRHSFNIVRIAEFAWCRLEPEDGRTDFAWLDRFLGLCAGRGMRVMLGVPARNVPPWLVSRDPTVAIVAYQGHREQFGTRYTVCINHPLVHDRALALAGQMARRYAGHETVASWHLDNELGDASICYCDHCRARFVAWLREKYGTPAELNRRWGLVFWSLEINDFDQVWLPSRSNHFPHNPGLLQDYRRFTSASTEAFVAEQTALFKRLAPRQAVTTNVQSMTRYHTDYHRMAAPLDVASINFYPPLSYNTVDLDIVRGLKGGAPFWVVEQKAGTPENKVRAADRVHTHNGFLNPEPGETRLWTWESIAHGADAVLYFRWRPSPFGAEQLHRGILNHDATPNRVSEEIGRTGAEIARLAPAIDGTRAANQVAMLLSCESRWALDYYYPHPDLAYRDYFLLYHGELERQHVGVDVVSSQRPLAAYKVVIAPLLYLVDPAIIANLVSYVAGGGTLVLTFRSCAKDENSSLYPSGLPREIADMLGVDIEESQALAPGVAASLVMDDGASHPASLWIDMLRPRDARVVGRYGSGWYRGKPAVTVGSGGRAWYVGTAPDRTFYTALLGRVLREAGVAPLLTAPRAVRACRRADGGRELLFLTNPTGEPQVVDLPREHRDLLAGGAVSGAATLEPWGVRVLESSGR
jgi:beta-galactosidase